MKQPVLARIADLMVMPEAGIRPVLALMDSARSSLKVKMFTFDQFDLIEGLEAAKARGVSVQVMLNPQRSSGTRANDGTFERLHRGGIDVAWTSPSFAVTHEKSMVIDGRVTLIATFNFVEKYFTHTRDYGLVIDDPAIVSQVSACFDADRSHKPFALPPDTPLALSPNNAREVMAGLIDGARSHLRVQHPKFSDMAIVDRLLEAHARGVRIDLICGGHHGISPSDEIPTFSALRALRRAGIHMRKQHQLRLHAKLVIADDSIAMVGSMNIDEHAFDLRRELGVVFDDANAVKALHRQFHTDWKEAKHFEPPDPLAPKPISEADPPVHDAIGPDPAYDID